MYKYRVECGIESTSSVTTIKKFFLANDCREYLNSLPEDTWYTVDMIKTGVRILDKNFVKDGVNYNEFVKCPKALSGIK